ncbi:unnamed protein product [Toxocara canis]|uniref:Glyco_18 domain-containing protein n=1 Tax=Toxocara canis TaxID=6265 RepID=A0A183UDL0_TOXCA|nr:unnamed protein product [Toxocara canis]
MHNSQWSVLLLAICTAFEFGTAQQWTSTNCSFYCFATPQKDEKINMTLYRSLDCTHFVYGFATVTRENQLKHATFYDLPTYTEQGNYRTFAMMKLDKPVKPLLGIRQKRSLTFIDDDFSRNSFAELVIETARRYHFEGLFFYFDDEHHYRNYRFAKFLDVLTTKADKEAAQNDGGRLFLVLAIPASRVQRAHHRLSVIESHFDALYVVADDIPAAEDPLVALHVQPLYPSETVPNDDSISENVDHLANSGVPLGKIIVGLSTWARSYMLEDPNDAGHGNPASGFGARGDINHRSDGRLSYGELCSKIRNKARIVYDSKAAVLSFTGEDGQWYSFEEPNHESFHRKIRWVSNHAYGGIGIMSVEGDDTTGRCGQGLLPMHRVARRLFQCSMRNVRKTSHLCTRICIVRPQLSPRKAFTFDAFLGSACSHIVISSADIQLSSVKFSKRAKNALSDFHVWSVDEKPQLILAIGAQQTSASWRVEIGNELSRTILANNIKQLVKEYNADGVQLSWTLEKMESVHDGEILAAMLTHLRSTLHNSTLLFLAVHPESLYEGCYNISTINSKVDYVIVDGHRFHASTNPFTGHHSPMFTHSQLLSDPKMTLEALANEWISRGVDNSKLIIGVSAEGIKQTLAKGHRSVDVLAAATITSNKIVRASDLSSVSQTEASWTSLNHYGGMAIYGIEMDNPRGECPHDRPYPILHAVDTAHICKQCPLLRPTSSCNPPIKIACSYRLPDENDKDPLRPQSIPFDKCTEVVVEEAILDENNELNYRDGRATANMKTLMRLVPRLGKKGLISSVRCQMSKPKFTQMLEQRTQLISRLIKHVDAFGFTGIELKCDHVLSADNKRMFTNLVNELSAQLNAANTEAQNCPRTISVRIPAWQRRLRNVYDISMLNSLHHVVLEPFEQRKSSTSTLLASPLFSTSDNDLSISSTIKSWLSDGLKRSSILLDLATYGVSQQLVSPSMNRLGDATLPQPIQILRQKQACMCHKNREPGYQLRTHYRTVSSYATTPKGEWITLETQETITYKMRYAMRERLAGIGMITLNEDDFANACSQGKFPLLSIVSFAQKSCGGDLEEVLENAEN